MPISAIRVPNAVKAAVPFVVAIQFALVALAGPASAHGLLVDSSPGAGESATGVVDELTLRFAGVVLATPTVTVLGPDGEPVAGSGPVEMADGDTMVRVPFPALSDPGVYRVEVEFVAGDGHPGQDAFTFSYRSGASSVEGVGAFAVALGLAAVAVALIGLARWRSVRTGGD